MSEWRLLAVGVGLPVVALAVSVGFLWLAVTVSAWFVAGVYAVAFSLVVAVERMSA